MSVSPCYEEYAHIRELEDTVGAQKRQAWQRWNVVRITHEQATEIAAGETAREEEEQGAAEAAAAGSYTRPLFGSTSALSVG